MPFSQKLVETNEYLLDVFVQFVRSLAVPIDGNDETPKPTARLHSTITELCCYASNMNALVRWFEPAPARDELPRQLNSPFDTELSEPLAIRAARELMAELPSGTIAPDLDTAILSGPEGGKMFGVLVVEDEAGRVGYLRAFSGMLAGRWDIEGFVPPIFARELRELVEPRGEALVKALTARVDAARADPARSTVEAELRSLLAAQDEGAATLRVRHRSNKARRDQMRASLAPESPGAHDVVALDGSSVRGAAVNESPEARPSLSVESTDARAAMLAALDQESRRDGAELRAAKAAWLAARTEVETRHRRLVRRLAALERLRRIVSNEVAREIFDTYVLTNRAGRSVRLRELYAPNPPSAGTGDCAAPKLLAYALRHRLEPRAIAELWWGAPPPGGARIEGAFYPACRDKCGPLLPFLLEGIPVATPRKFRPQLTKTPLPIVYEDDRLVVVNKPDGLLSVPGTDPQLADTVLARMRARYPNATGPLLVHRLDMETSGLLLVALDERAHRFLQKQFLRRTIEKNYLAWLDGLLERDTGIIELPLRVDLEQRPRQLVDFVHGKNARTRFEVLARSTGRTRIAFHPETGRTHQLRVHAAHPLGLGIPIAGDRLYGRPGERLMLHAESLVLEHPTTHERLSLRAPAPF